MESAAVNGQELSTQLSLGPSMGYVKPYLPVVRSARVIKVWVPPHVSTDDKDVFIAGHWTFLRMAEEGWAINEEKPRGLDLRAVVPLSSDKERDLP
jgi:hypothetical protein